MNDGYRIAILGGAGMMGQGIVRDLVSDRTIVDVLEIRVCDSDQERMDRLRSELDDERVTSLGFDASRVATIRRCLEGVDLCINSVPTLAGFQLQIFETALECGVNYIDLGGLGTYTVKQLEWHDRYQSKGLTAVLGVGADPGLSNVICRAVADQLERIDRINLYWAAELIGPENPVLVPPYSVSTVLAEYAHPSTQFLDGRHVQCAPMEGIEVLDLPEPWGRCEFMYSPHSEQLTVPVAEGIREKGIREFTWKLHLPHREHEAWVGLVKAGFGDFDNPVVIDGKAIKPIDVLNAVIGRNMTENATRIPAQDSHEIHMAIGRGHCDGRPATARCQVIVSPNDLYEGYVDAATSMNASIAAQLLLESRGRHGVFAPESFFEPERYFAECEKRHFTVESTFTYDTV